MKDLLSRYNMRLNRVLSLAKSGSLLPYTFGRFATVRLVYSRINGLLRPIDSRPKDQLCADTIFPLIDVEDSVKCLRRDAIAFGFNLPQRIVDQIYEYASYSMCKSSGFNGLLAFQDIAKGLTPDGNHIAMAEVVNPMGCDAISKIYNSQVLRQTCMHYLGYTPHKREIRLFWSFVSNLNDEERRNQHQTIDYHVDIHDFNFCYAHFYLTNTDARSGAHVMVRGSHINKPLRWLFGSARKSDSQITDYYPEDDILTLEGPSGTGFLEDTSCYHKALSPVDRIRLLLQIRYH